MKLIPPPNLKVLELTPNLIHLPDELNRFWVNKEELRLISLRRFLKPVKRGVQFLAYKYDRKQSEILRVCVHLGAPYLYGLPGVAEIRDARMHVLRNGDEESEDIQAFENRHFDMQTEQKVRFGCRFPEADISQIEGLADLLSLDRSTVYQMAMIYPLLHTELPVPIYNQLGRLLIRFRAQVERWGKQAAKIKRECEVNPNGYRIPLEEILEDSWMDKQDRCQADNL